MPQYRKRLRLANFDYGQAGTYFITVCVKDRKCILGTIPPNVGADVHISPQVELSHYGKVVEKYIQQIYGLDKYVIMPNHIHLIVRIDGPMETSAPTSSIPNTIKSFKTRVHKDLGFPLFQRSYHDHIIRDEEKYREIWRYVDENPLRWELDRYYEENLDKPIPS